MIERPQDTILVVISDLFEGGDSREMLARTAALVASGVSVVALLALNDDGAPSYDARHAAEFAALGIPSFACTPDVFPDLMAATIRRENLQTWAASRGIALQGGAGARTS